MNAGENSKFGNKLLLLISLVQLLVLLFLVSKMDSKQELSAFENRNFPDDRFVFESSTESSTKSVPAEPAHLYDHKELIKNLSSELSSELLRDGLFAKSIDSSIRTELKKIVSEQSVLLRSQTKEDRSIVKVDSLTFDELTQSTEDFIASGDISIVTMNDFFKQLGSLNKKQRQQVRRLIAQAINSGNTSLIE